MSPFSCRSLEEFGRFIVEQCAIFRGKMSTDKIFLGCREHEINLQDLGRTPSGPPGGGRRGGGLGRGGGGRQCEAWGVSCRAPTNIFQSWKTTFVQDWFLRSFLVCSLNLGLKTGFLVVPPCSQISNQGDCSMISCTIEHICLHPPGGKN